MTLENQLQQILDIKQDINEAISQQGVNISQTDAFSSYANKIKSIQGSNTVQNGFSVTDIKITDHILNETETIGWARTGQTVRKTDNPDFYNKCLQEYNQSIVSKGYVSANVTLIGDLTEHKGVLSGFVSERSGAKVLKTVPSTVTSFEMVAKIFVSEDHSTYKAIYCQPVSTNYITPQFEVGTAGKVQVAVSKSGSSWDYSIQDTERCVGQTLWVKSTLKDGVLSLLKSFDGKDYKLIGSVDNVQGCKWTTGIGVGVDSDTATHALDGGTIDLMECYIDINEERWWTGCETFETKEHIDGHKYVTPDKQEYIDNYYKKLGYVDYYIIDEEKEQITLPQLIEDECTYIYFCTGTQIKQDIIVDLSKEIELNNPFFLGQSQYFENEPNNLSWLKSTSEFHSKDLYPSMYEFIKENIEKGTKDFKRVNEEYDDYSYILDEENETFRLPLLNGSETLFGTDVQALSFNPQPTSTEQTYTVPYNGYVTIIGYKSNKSSTLTVSLNGHIVSQTRALTDGLSSESFFFAKKGDTITVATDSASTGWVIATQQIVKAIGNGSLYYFVGEAVNNANLVDLGKMSIELSNKLAMDLSNMPSESKTYLTGLGLPSEKYIDLQLGASGCTYTAPADGYVTFAKVAGKIPAFVQLLVSPTALSVCSFPSNTYDWGYVTLPVRKGQQFNTNYTATGETKYFRFIYAQGAQ